MFDFLKRNKKWWLLGVVLLLLFVGGRYWDFRWLSVQATAWLRHAFLFSTQEENILKQEVETLRARLVRLEEEKFFLAQQMGHGAALSLPNLQTGVLSQVQSFEVNPHFQSLLINRGSKHGVAMGQAVLASGALVGRVTQVQPAYAKVLLVTDLRSTVDVLDQRTRAQGTLVGRQEVLGLQRSHALTQGEYFSAKSEVRSGDLLVTSGRDGVFPKGIPVGVVQAVQKDATGLFWRAQVRPAVDLTKVETVLVLKTEG